jgi:hypothetical protein
VRHHGPVFAVLLARWIGYREPLIRRLLDPAVEKTPAELAFVADVLAGRFKWPKGGPKSVAARRRQLHVAATYLEFLYADGKRGKDTAAVAHAVRQCKISGRFPERKVWRNIKYAKALAGGEWWRSAEHLARKGPRKREPLHRTH